MRDRRSVFSMLGVGIVWVLFQVAGWCAGEVQPVTVEKNDKTPSLSNGLLKLDYDTASGRVSLTGLKEGQAFKASGDLGKKAGAVKVEKIAYPGFQDGQALVVEQGEGRRCRVSLFPGVPFAFFQPIIGNATKEDTVIEELKAFSLTLDLGTPFEDLKALGSAGLTAPDQHSGSYFFLAVADPKTRAGVVSGWVSQERGSGIVFSGRQEKNVRIDAQTDYGHLLVKAGKEAEGEIFALGFFADARVGLEDYANQIKRYYHIQLKPIPSGYCTWYAEQFGGASDEKHLAELAALCAKELKPFGFDFVQIDDKWQLGAERHGPAKNFTNHRPDGPYPSGMKKTADYLKSLGLTPGIWFMPFAGDHMDPFFKDHLDWFVHLKDGSVFESMWGGTSLDMTNPDAQAYLRSVVRRIAKEWGYTYFKMDGLYTGLATENIYVNNAYNKKDRFGEGVFKNPEKTNIEAYRDGLKLIRQEAGPDVFFLGCCASQDLRSLPGAFGLLDAMRIGPDNGADWESLKRGPWHGTNRYFLHGRVWYNDPDPIYVRASTPLEQSRLICSWVALSGQLNASSDWMPALPPERMDLLKRTMPNHGLTPRPVDLFENPLANVWLLTDERSGGRRDVVGLFNWEKDKTLHVDRSVAEIGLPKADQYVAFDFWGGRFLRPFKDRLVCDVPPASCVILAVRPVGDHPVLVSTSRHITQGVVDVKSERWDAEKRTLVGTSKIVVNDPYVMRLVVPTGAKSYKAVKVEASDGVQAKCSQSGPQVEVVLNSKENRDVEWRIVFEEGAVEVGKPEPVRNLKVEPDYLGVTLTWEASFASGYRIERNDGQIFEVTDKRLVDSTLKENQKYSYQVKSVGWDGTLSEAVKVEGVEMKELKRPTDPPVPEVQISSLDAVEATTGWGKVQKNKSCDGNALTVDGKTYSEGMGVHAASSLMYRIPEGFGRFVAVVGLDDEKKDDKRSSVVFEVYADTLEGGKTPVLLEKSPVLCDATARSWAFNLEVPSQFKVIRLVVSDGGDGVTSDHGDWVNAGFLKK